MIRENLERIHDDPALFVETMCFRADDDIETDLIQQDGHVICITNGRSHNRAHLHRALYEATTRTKHEVLIITPNPHAANGSILLIEDEIDRGAIPTELWGVEHIDNEHNSIMFENGSRIRARAAGVRDDGTGFDGDAIRGFSPDRLIVHNWDEEGYSITDETREGVLVPMAIDADVWLNDEHLRSDLLTDSILTDGVYVERVNDV